MQPNLQPLPRLTPKQALWRGTVTALVVALPAGLLNQLLVEDDGATTGVLVLWLLILLGGAAGGWAVIRLSPDAPLSYAAGAGGFAYVIVQSIGIVRRLLIGADISWLGYPFLAVLMATCGMLGGMFARRSSRSHTEDGERP
jgi:hypothetical protein